MTDIRNNTESQATAEGEYLREFAVKLMGCNKITFGRSDRDGGNCHTMSMARRVLIAKVLHAAAKQYDKDPEARRD